MVTKTIQCTIVITRCSNLSNICGVQQMLFTIIHTRKYKFMYIIILITLVTSVDFLDVRMRMIIIHHRLYYTILHCITIFQDEKKLVHVNIT